MTTTGKAATVRIGTAKRTIKGPGLVQVTIKLTKSGARRVRRLRKSASFTVVSTLVRQGQTYRGTKRIRLRRSR